MKRCLPKFPAHINKVVAQQQQMADENYQVFSYKDCLSKENVNGFEDYIEWCLDTKVSVENKDTSFDPGIKQNVTSTGTCQK